MRALGYVQQGFDCKETIYPSLYKYLIRVIAVMSRIKRASVGRNKKRKLKRKK